jgi:predicted small lipoprotein YifL
MKKISLLFIAIIMIFTITACGTQRTPTEDTNNSQNNDNTNDDADTQIASSNDWLSFLRIIY